MDLRDVLTELCAVSAPSGAEMELASLLERRWAPRCRAVRRDPTGNVLAHVGGSGPRVLVQAHMDQVGYVVRFVTESGQLLLDTAQGDRRTGPYLPRIDDAQRVLGAGPARTTIGLESCGRAGEPRVFATAGAAGFTDHLTKPVDPEALNAVIKAHLHTDK